MSVDAAVAEHQAALFGIAYRMLGSVADAEDAVQETFIRWAEAERSAIANPRGWLVTVLTRLCLDRLRSAQVRREQYVGPWLPEPLLVDRADPADVAEMGDSLSLAFLVVLESLSPPERAVFLLHDVFGYPFNEIAVMLDRTAAACRQLAARARRHVAERRPRYEADGAVRDRVAEAFLDACTGGGVEDLVRLLDPDAVLRSDGGGAVSAARRPVTGADRVARFLVGLRRRPVAHVSVERLRVNGIPGALVRVAGEPYVLMGLDVSDGRVSAVHMIRNPSKLAAALGR